MIKFIPNILQRYLAFSFAVPFFVSMIFFVTFLLISQIFRIITEVVNKGIDVVIVLKLMGHIAISFIPNAIPFSIFLGTLYALGRLSEDSEIIAMRSYGLSKFKLISPFLIMGVFIAVAAFSLGSNLIPYSKKVFQHTVVKITSRGMLADVKPEQFFTDIPKLTLFADRVLDQGETLTNLFIHFQGKGEDSQIIVAKRGNFDKTQHDPLGQPELRLALYDGNITKIIAGKRDVEKVLFDKYDFPINFDIDAPGLLTKNSMKSTMQLWRWIRDVAPTHENKKDVNKAKVEFFSRLNIPLECFAFLILGFSLGIKKGRGSQKNGGVIGFGFLIAYYALYFTGVSLGEKGVVPAWLAVYTPTTILFIAGFYYYRKLDWVA